MNKIEEPSILNGAIIFKTISYKIQILEIETTPNGNPKDFTEWLENKAIELGTGKYNEYYFDEYSNLNTMVYFKVDVL